MEDRWTNLNHASKEDLKIGEDLRDLRNLKICGDQGGAGVRNLKIRDLRQNSALDGAYLLGQQTCLPIPSHAPLSPVLVRTQPGPTARRRRSSPPCSPPCTPAVLLQLPSPPALRWRASSPAAPPRRLPPQRVFSTAARSQMRRAPPAPRCSSCSSLFQWRPVPSDGARARRPCPMTFPPMVLDLPGAAPSHNST
ncbi:hypothetical protein SORBI_3003G378201 [Sorghum bicolor]|uniref:Uncharacterized protein n=1 Tax=Sorghum bicolor TaxID=4558 RepID=A0A1W0W0T5_SORBI|nr:hypothetical protein SORBI_3003G378201 [Sorghum bicolor]